MRRSLRRAGTGMVALVVGAGMVTGTAGAASAGGARSASVAGRPAAGPARPGEVCRSAEVRPVAGLVSQARVCVRFRDGVWVGSGQLVLRASRRVSGAYSWGPRYYPVRPGVYVGNGRFDLVAGQTATYRLDGAGEAEASDTGADWEVWIGVPNGIRATGFEAQVMSPVAARRPSADQASRFTGTTRWTCAPRRVSGEGLSGVATLCLRQVRGRLESRATLTYTSTATVDLGVGLAVDGEVGTTSNTVPVAASPRLRRTVTLPASVAQARRQDHRAATFLRLGSRTVQSTAVPVR